MHDLKLFFFFIHKNHLNLTKKREEFQSYNTRENLEHLTAAPFPLLLSILSILSSRTFFIYSYCFCLLNSYSQISMQAFCSIHTLYNGHSSSLALFQITFFLASHSLFSLNTLPPPPCSAKVAVFHVTNECN